MAFCPGIIHFQDCDFLICSLKLVLHDQGPAFSSSLFGAKCPSSLFFSQLSCKGSSNYIERPSPFSSGKLLSALGSISNVTSLRSLPLPPGLGLSSVMPSPMPYSNQPAPPCRTYRNCNVQLSPVCLPTENLSFPRTSTVSLSSFLFLVAAMVTCHYGCSMHAH